MKYIFNKVFAALPMVVNSSKSEIAIAVSYTSALEF